MTSIPTAFICGFPPPPRAATQAIRDMKKISNRFQQGAVNIIILILFPSLSSAETDDRQQFQCLNIVLNNKNWTIIFRIQMTRRQVSLAV